MLLVSHHLIGGSLKNRSVPGWSSWHCLDVLFFLSKAHKRWLLTKTSRTASITCGIFIILSLSYIITISLCLVPSFSLPVHQGIFWQHAVSKDDDAPGFLGRSTGHHSWERTDWIGWHGSVPWQRNITTFRKLTRAVRVYEGTKALDSPDL